jgi:hypothetical protein
MTPDLSIAIGAKVRSVIMLSKMSRDTPAPRVVDDFDSSTELGERIRRADNPVYGTVASRTATSIPCRSGRPTS